MSGWAPAALGMAKDTGTGGYLNMSICPAGRLTGGKDSGTLAPWVLASLASWGIARL